MSNIIGAEGLLTKGVIGEPDHLVAKFLRCLWDSQVTSNLTMSSATLIFYDWFLTSSDEMAFLWRWDRCLYIRTLFFLTRYSALVCTILDLLPPSVRLANVATFLRFVIVICSEAILATKPWIMWGKSRSILAVLLLLFFPGAVIGFTVVVRDIATTRVTVVAASLALRGLHHCRVFGSAVKHGWILPHMAVVVFEAVVLALTLYRVLPHSRGPQRQRSNLLDVLWIDGVIYFIFAFLLGILNVVMVLQTSDPRLRTGGAQMQMAFHSILSTRIVLHITAVLKQDPVDSRSTTLVQRGHHTRMESVDSCGTLVIVTEEGAKFPNDRLVPRLGH